MIQHIQENHLCELIFVRIDISLPLKCTDECPYVILYQLYNFF